MKDYSFKRPFEDGTDSDNDDSISQSVSNSYLSRRRVVMLTIALLYGAGNVIVPSLIWNLGNDTIGMFFTGALATEIGLLSASVAFARGSILAAMTSSTLLIVFLCASFIMGLRRMDSNMPMEVAIFFFGIGFGAFVVTVGCLLFFRWFWRVQFSLEKEPFSDLPQPTTGKISIRYLMLTTAAIAIAICVIRWSIPASSQSIPGREFFQFAIMSGLECVESLCVLLLCLQLVYLDRSKRRMLWSILFLFVFCGLFPFLNAALVQLFTREIVYQYAHLAYAYIVGLTFFLIVTMLLMRFVGYRLVGTERPVA